MSAPVTTSQDDDITSQIDRFLAESDPEFRDDEEEENPAKAPETAKPVSRDTKKPAAETKPAESKDDEEEEPAKEEEAPAEESSEDEISTLDELATALDVKADDLLDTLTWTPPGEGSEPVTLRALVERFQATPADAENDPEVQALRGTLKQERDSFAKQYDDTILSLQGHTLAMLDGVEADKARLAELEDSNPQEYIRLSKDIGRRMTLIDKSVDALRSRVAADEQRAEKEHEQTANVELASLLKAIPAWRNPEARKTEVAEIAKYLMGKGLKGEEIGKMIDHRLILIARDAMKGAALSATAEAGKTKRTLKLPKGAVRRAERGTERSAQAKRAANIGAMKRRLKESGDETDAARLIFETQDL